MVKQYGFQTEGRILITVNRNQIILEREIDYEG